MIIDEGFSCCDSDNLIKLKYLFDFIRQKYKIEISEMLFSVNYTQLYTKKLIDFKNYLVKKHFY